MKMVPVSQLRNARNVVVYPVEFAQMVTEFAALVRYIFFFFFFFSLSSFNNFSFLYRFSDCILRRDNQ